VDNLTITQDSHLQGRWAVRTQCVGVILPTERVAKEFAAAYEETPEATPKLEWTEDSVWPYNFYAASYPFGLHCWCWMSQWFGEIKCHTGTNASLVATGDYVSLVEAQSQLERIVAALAKMTLHRLGRTA